ncbi:hypothetical protein ACHAXA_005868 [Cyclostephanos tholiformis]|uniref:Uncharacterized protein n=1 Tax=Cyclostephanos tholiformis TaxID=382380 RepID=A0ABD3SCX6_9STRA
MSRSFRPDPITSSGPVVKDEPADYDHRRVVPPGSNDRIDYDEAGDEAEDEDDDDPIVRTIDVYISPALSGTLHLLQFPIEPAHGRLDGNHHRDRPMSSRTPPPIRARFRPRHNMLELEYPIPPYDRDHRRLPDNMCLSTRTHVSSSIAPGTHMALARLGGNGTRLDLIPLRRHVMQMRPSFGHLHDGIDDEDENGGDDENGEVVHKATGGGGSASSDRHNPARPIMFARRETERSATARRNSYAHKRASEAGEEWIELDAHGAAAVVGSAGGGGGGGRHSINTSSATREALSRVMCADVENALVLAGLSANDENDADVLPPGARRGGMDDRGARYVRSLNYLDSYSSGRGVVGGGGTEWTPSNAALANDRHGEDDVDMEEATDTPGFHGVMMMERAIAELAAKLAVLMQNGHGTMMPYCVIRSRFHPARVSDEILTAALSSCAVLVRGNFALKSTLAKFLSHAAGGGGGGGGGDGRKKMKLMREMRDLILLLLNMHGMVQRERLARAYSSWRGGGGGDDERRMAADGGYYDPIINPDTITFVLKTVARKSDNCWIAKVDDDEGFAAKFPEVAACHALYWMKKREMLADLVELYESVEDCDMEC